METRPRSHLCFLDAVVKSSFLLGSPSYFESLLFLSRCRIAPFCSAAFSREARVLSVDVGVLPRPISLLGLFSFSMTTTIWNFDGFL